MSSAKINGIELHYQTHGEGEAIVFAHGAGGNLLSWWQQIPFFSQNYKCIVFDHRGFGHSLDAPDGPGGEAFVDDLRGLLDHLEIDSAHLVAQSMGGRTALGFALAHPERTRSLLMAGHTRRNRRAGACGHTGAVARGSCFDHRDWCQGTILWIPGEKAGYGYAVSADFPNQSAEASVRHSRTDGWADGRRPRQDEDANALHCWR